MDKRERKIGREEIVATFICFCGYFFFLAGLGVIATSDPSPDWIFGLIFMGVGYAFVRLIATSDLI